MATASVIICAYTDRRWDELELAVESALAQTVPVREVVVVIDNNENLLARAKSEFTGAVVVPNAHERGLSGGRTTGAEAATADVLIFMDDDAVADERLVEHHLAGYASDPDVLGVGGSIDPIWSVGRPKWFPTEFNWVVGCTYRGMPTHDARIRNPIGANMSMRAELLSKAGGFHADFGRKEQAGKKVSGAVEETEFCIRATREHPGGYWLYKPAANVRHLVTPERSTWSYFVERCREEGAAKAMLVGVAGSGEGLEAERRYATVALPAGVLVGLRDALTLRPWGLARAGAIVAGLAVTAWAYVMGRLGR